MRCYNNKYLKLWDCFWNQIMGRGYKNSSEHNEENLKCLEHIAFVISHFSIPKLCSLLVSWQNKTNGSSIGHSEIFGRSLFILCVLVTQSCQTLCDPMDCGLPGSSLHGILQGRILERVAFPFSRRSSRPRYRTQVSCIAGRFFTV